LQKVKKNIEENVKTLPQQTTELQSIFPDLPQQELSNEDATQNISDLKEFLTRVESKMKILLTSGEKLFEHLSELSKDMAAFAEAFENLTSAEQNYPYKPNIERQGINKSFDEWSQFQSRQTEIYYEYFYRALRHEHEDIVSFLELFKYRETIEIKWNKAKIKLDKWNINNDQKNGVELKEKEEQAKKKRHRRRKRIIVTFNTYYKNNNTQ